MSANPSTPTGEPPIAETLVTAGIDKVRAIVADQKLAAAGSPAVVRALDAAAQVLDVLAEPGNVSLIGLLGKDGFQKLLRSIMNRPTDQGQLDFLANEASADAILGAMDAQTSSLETQNANRAARKEAFVQIASRIEAIGAKFLLALLLA